MTPVPIVPIHGQQFDYLLTINNYIIIQLCVFNSDFYWTIFNLFQKMTELIFHKSFLS